MAASTIEVLLRFTGDPRNAKDAIAQVRADLTRSAQQQVTTARNANKQVATEAKQQTKTLEGEERARVRAAESLQRQRSAALIAQWKLELREKQKVEQQKQQAERGGGGQDFTVLLNSVPVLRGVTSQLGSLTSATAGAGAATAGLAGPIGIATAAFALQAGAIATVSQGLFELAKSTAAYQGGLHDLSQQLGISVELLAAFEVSARKTGGSIDSVAASLAIFQKRIEDAKDPSTEQAKLFRELGVSAQDVEGALRQTLAGLFALGEGSEQLDKSLTLFGRSGRFVLAILKESQGDIDSVVRRLSQLGGVTTEQARIADEFNDQLVDLDTQLKGLGTLVIPAFLSVLKDTGKVIEDNKLAFKFLQGVLLGVALSITGPLRIGIVFLNTELKKLESVLLVIAPLFQKVKEAVEFISGHPIKITAGGTSAETAAVTPPPIDTAPRQLQDELEARRQLQGVLNADFAAQQQRAKDNIAAAEREFNAGKRTRQGLLAVTIDSLRKQTKAEIDALEVERTIKLAESALAKDDIEKRTQLGNVILGIDSQIAEKRSTLARNVADARAKTELDERRATLAHERAKLDQVVAVGNERIKILEAEIRNEITTREKGLEEIERIENLALQARGQLLKKELELAGVGPDRQTVLDKISAIEAERTALQRNQGERRLQLDADTAKREIDQLRRGIALREAERNGEQARIRINAESGVISQSEAIRQLQQIFTTAHEDRIKLIDKELASEKLALERRRQLLSEKAIAEREFTDQYKAMSRERMEQLAIEGASRIPAPDSGAGERGGMGAAKPEIMIDDSTLGKVPDALGQWAIAIEAAIEGFRQLQEQMQSFGSFAGTFASDIVGGIAGAVAQATQAWALYGESFGQAMKKALAALLASKAAEAAYMSALHAAYALGSLAFGNFAAAAQHALVAAKFAALAAGAGIAARAVAGNSFQKNAGGSFGGSSGGPSSASASTQPAKPIPVDMDRRTANQTATRDVLEIRFTGKLGDVIEANWIDRYNGGGRLRNLVRTDRDA